jgi:tRNA-dihydrouridine synthase B
MSPQTRKPSAPDPRSGADDALILAPLRGYSGHLFRRLFMRHFGGFDRALAPFIPTVGSRRIPARLLVDLRPENNRHLPVEPQLLGTDPDDFLRMAASLADLGYTRVNWNLGCPFPMVAKKGRGSGMLPHPDRIEAFLASVLPRLPMGLSIKLRLGRREPSEIGHLIPILNRYPLREITLHPRTGVQMYAGTTDLNAFGTCLAAITHPVTYNGDITTPEDVKRLRVRFPAVRSWMIGRGALADPFLPARIKGQPISGDPVAVLRTFHDDLLAAYGRELSGPGHLLDRMKAYWTYFLTGVANGRKVAKQIHRCRSLDRYHRITDAFFDAAAAVNHGAGGNVPAAGGAEPF